MKNKTKQFISKKDPSFIYGLTPIWKLTLKLTTTGMLMAFFIGLFTFADQLMLVNFMPKTQRFCFNNLFFDSVFWHLVNELQNSVAAHNLYIYLMHTSHQDNNTLKMLVTAIGNSNGLGIYNSDNIVRSSVSLIVAISDIVYIIPSLYAIGVSIKYAQAIGKKDYQAAQKIWQNGFYGTLFVTLIGCLITFILIPLVTPAQVVSNHQLQNPLLLWAALRKNLLTQNIPFHINDYLTQKNGIYYEHLHFLVHNKIYTYYLSLGNNQYLNISSSSLLGLLNNHTLQNAIEINNSQLLQQNQFAIVIDNSNKPQNSLNLNFIWIQYFHTIRYDSITWAEDFLYILDAGLLICSISSLISTILRCDGAIMMATLITIVPIALVILLDYLLIYYAQIGMDGAAVSTIIGWTIQMLWCIFYVHFSKKLKTQMSLRALKIKKTALDFHLLWILFMYGGTIFVGNIGWMITDILLMNQVTYVSKVLIQNFGTEYFLSIMGAILPIINVFMIMIVGSFQYISPIFSYNYGSNQIHRFRKAYWFVTLYVAIITLTIYFLLSFVSAINHEILSWFNITLSSPNQELNSAIKLFQIWFIMVPSFLLSISGQLIYLACNRPGTMMFVALLRSTIVYVPVLYLFANIAINHQTFFNGSFGLNQTFSPYKNQAIWFFMWNQPVSYLTSGLIIMIMSSIFIYTKLQYHKKAWYWNWMFHFFNKKRLQKDCQKMMQIKIIH